MKIIILTQNVKDIQGMKNGLIKAQSLLSKVGLFVEFDYKETTKKFTSLPLSSDVVSNGYMVNPQEIISETPQTDGVVCFIYDWSTIYPHPTNPCTTYTKGSETPIQIPVNWYSDFTQTPNITYPEVLTQFFLHEMSHYIADITEQTDLTHFQYKNPEWNNKQPIDYYLFLIKGLVPLIPNMQPTYKYFKPKSDPLMVGVSPDLMKVLDKAREIAGVPFKITSGFRNDAKNREVGGVPDSSHTKGLAVDIAVTNKTRQAIMRAFLTCGTPLFIEDCPSHIHVDIDSSRHNMGDAIISQNG